MPSREGNSSDQSRNSANVQRLSISRIAPGPSHSEIVWWERTDIEGVRVVALTPQEVRQHSNGCDWYRCVGRERIRVMGGDV